MDNEPMYIPVQQRYLSNTRTYEEVERLSVDEMKHLLIMMGTITVISFILVVSIVTILAAFVWYSRRRLARNPKCTCNLKDDDLKCLEEGGSGLPPPPPHLPLPRHPASPLPAVYHHQQQQASHQPVKEVFVNAGYMYPGSGDGRGNQEHQAWLLDHEDVWSLHQQQFQQHHNVVPNAFARRGLRQAGGSGAAVAGNNVIVNPLPPLPPGEESSLQGVSPTPPGYQYKHDDSTDVLHTKDNIEKGSSSGVDPIYQEIGAVKEKVNIATDTDAPPAKEAAEETETASSRPPADTGKAGQKKEIEYWQITAKEVVKFRPCTETFIHRNNV